MSHKIKKLSSNRCVYHDNFKHDTCMTSWELLGKFSATIFIFCSMFILTTLVVSQILVKVFKITP